LVEFVGFYIAVFTRLLDLDAQNSNENYERKTT